MKESGVLFAALLTLSIGACGNEANPGLDAMPSPLDAMPPWRCPTPLLRGIDVTHADLRAEVDELGANAVHFWIHWDAVQAEIVGPVLQSVDDVTEQMVADFAVGTTPGVVWDASDAAFERWQGLQIVPAVGSGWLVDMPSYQGTRLTPDAIGRSAYLAHLHLYTRAVTRRYRGLSIGWQIENEANTAGIELIAGIREGNSWDDATFVTELITTLSKAVRQEDPNAWVTTNLHTDIFWKEHVTAWNHLVDWVGLDAYPNYGNGDPVDSITVNRRAGEARRLSGGKPVVVMETGYASAPANKGFSEEGQAQYFSELYEGFEEAGGCGVFYYKLRTSEEVVDGNTPQGTHWGMFRADGTKKPVWQVVHEFMGD